MKDIFQFTSQSEYLNRLLVLTHRLLDCLASEFEAETKGTDGDFTLELEKTRTDLANVYTAAGEALHKGVFLPLEYLFWLFDCDLFERHAIVLALLVQINLEAATLLASIHQNSHINFVTPYIVCRTFEKEGQFGANYSYFAKDSRLLNYFFNEREVNVLSRLTLDRRILEFILGGKANNSYYYPAAILWNGEKEGFDADKMIAGRLGTYLQNCKTFDRHIVFNLFGAQGSGRKSCLKYIARDNGLNLMFIDPVQIAEEKEPLEVINKIMRECLIFQAIPVVMMSFSQQDMPLRGSRVVLDYLLRKVQEDYPYSFAVTERQLLPCDFKEHILLITEELGRLSPVDFIKLWESESRKYIVDENISYYELAGEFTLTPGKIKEAFRAAAVLADLYGNGIISLSDLKRGCYSTLQGGMGSKAVKMTAGYTWNDLVLPPYQKGMLLTACNQVRYKYKVYQKWGFQDKVVYGKNVSLLFTGPPGTGKTMAAQVVANELDLDIYKIELATIVSKYIGETEKNLAEIFNQAQKSQVILFFDEADVLFSKRTEVKDSNDKYSNMEAAFLLQKMEEYDGVTILATNYMQNFDEAFKRRLKFIIDFPFPSEEQRREIWQKVFPAKLPLGELDFEYLTTNFELSGSNIKNIALHSAFLAAADGSKSVEMKHILAAVRNEFTKNGKIFTKKDAGEYYILL